MSKFTNFLLSNNVYKEFLDNFYGSRNSISDYLRNTPERDYFYVAFSWDTTKEGVEFWKEINRKWLEYIN